ncbi:MAG TPA: hypothetical protein VHE81_03510 [Lacipirellulaceae bacterium]|nr:hypothetical protein [Lacipirellulaceae bacterium]
MSNIRVRRALLITIVLCLAHHQLSAQGAEDVGAGLAKLMRQIGQAQSRSDEASVISLADKATRLLGSRAGIPGTPAKIRRVPPDVPLLTQSETAAAFKPYERAILRRKWWRIGDDPTRSAHPLRETASVVLGCTFACRAECDDSNTIRETAKSAGDYLVWAQEQAGRGLFPFPARRDASERSFVVAARFIQKAESLGRLDEVVHNGWIVDDLGDGGLQYDNGVCGVAILELYRLTHDAKYLESARRAADWALRQPVVPNWNYNSFSVFLLAEMARDTGNAKYLKAAVKKAQLGVYPGQLTEGAHRGRWFDPHNAEITYHYIIVRSLVSLAAALKDGSPERQQAASSLLLALRARDPEFTSKEIPDVESALEALVLLQQYFPDSTRTIGEAQQTEALRAVASYCIVKVRAGGLPVAPGAWGRYLYLVRAHSKPH